MENQIPTPQPITPVPSIISTPEVADINTTGTKKEKNTNFWMISTVVLTMALICVTTLFILSTATSQNQTPSPTPTPYQNSLESTQPTPDPTSTPKAKPKIGYTLPATWTLKTTNTTPDSILELQSKDSCTQLSIEDEGISVLTSKEYAQNYYDVKTLTQAMLYKKQYKIEKLDSTTISSQGIGELFTIFVKNQNNILLIKATESTPEGEDTLPKVVCKTNEADISSLIESLKLSSN